MVTRKEGCFYCPDAKLQKIFQRIYFDNYKMEDLKEYILTAFSKLKNTNQFYDILDTEAKNFGKKIKDSISHFISRVVYSRDINTNKHNFKSFGANRRLYVKAIDALYEHFKIFEAANTEVDKLSKVYLEKYLGASSNKIALDRLFFHKKIFIDCVYNDHLVNSFIKSLVKFFSKNKFYAKKFSKCQSKITEVYQNLERLWRTLKKNNIYNEKILEKFKCRE